MNEDKKQEQAKQPEQIKILMPGIVGEVDLVFRAISMVANRMFIDLQEGGVEEIPSRTEKTVKFLENVVHKIPEEYQGFPVLLALLKLAGWGLDDFLNTIQLTGDPSCFQKNSTQTRPYNPPDPSSKKV